MSVEARCRAHAPSPCPSMVGCVRGCWGLRSQLCAAMTTAFSWTSTRGQSPRPTGRSPDFDFRKLVRISEEINKAYSEGCYFATAMLTRGLLDHVPPVFGMRTFNEVANNYAGGGKSIKETMLHLESAARKTADAHLHMSIRKSETLPTAQQVNCGRQLDGLLSEIVRITR
jgi:hypothetical protein